MKKILFDMDGTLARFYERRASCLEEMYNEGFFRLLNPYTNVLFAAKMLIEQGYDVGILSACITPHCREEKKVWLRYFLPEIKAETIILCNVGENKAEVVKSCGYNIEDTVLIDDYTYNLNQWCEAGGTGIKIRNELNGTKGTWTGLDFSHEDLPEVIVEKIINGIS